MRKLLCLILLASVFFSFWFLRARPQPLHFFNLDLHVAVIGDVKEIFEKMGHKVTTWSLSQHAWVFHKKRHRTEILNERTWGDLSPEMCDRFYERYKEELEPYDAFIVTHTPAFALLYERWNKPILIINSTRYENPFTDDPVKWRWLDRYLQDGTAKGKIVLVSNNKADQQYLKSYTGLDSALIPNLCLYTKARYAPSKKGFIVKALWGKEFESVVAGKLTQSELIQNQTLKHFYKWKTLYSYQGIVHVPYQVSTMSLFEQYSANIPLFFPTKRFLKELCSLYPDVVLSQLSFAAVRNLPLASMSGLNRVDDPAILQQWIDWADYYDEEAMPYLQYYDSFAELEHLLQTTDCKAVSRKMARHNRKRKQVVIQQWLEILEKIRY